ncbi:MAG: carbon-nitrogen hydrolase family protein [Clostridiales bacterium]|nr:carbon-nitrogen hydrolase family protein [Clostridiales bacterium]
MMDLKVALLQLVPGKTQEENLRKGMDACIIAKEKGADVALFPEMWNNGYAIPQDKTKLEKMAVTKDSNFVQSFRKLAFELEMAIGITFLEKNDPKPLNSVLFFDRKGKEILHYSKVHTCAFEAEAMLEPGDDFYVAEMDTGNDVIRFGSMICFDREFPESARILMMKGAEVILAPNACPMEINRLAALRTRAYENMVAVATCNYAEGQPDCNGHSNIFSGVPWKRDEEGVRDMCVLEAPGEEGVYVGSINMDELRKHRENDVMGWKFRRPEKYDILLQKEK